MQEMQETRVQSLSWDNNLEEEMATPVFLPGESHGQRSQAGYSPYGCKELDMTEAIWHNYHNTLLCYHQGTYHHLKLPYH